MEEISNAQLMNAIKLLTRKVEDLEKLLQKKDSAKIALPTWNHPGLPKEIAEVVASEKGLAEAAAKLDMSAKKLTTMLQNSGIPHLYGEKWSVAIKRIINGTPIVDGYEYPEDWPEKLDKILKNVEIHGPKKVAEHLGKPLNVLQRFIQVNTTDILKPL